jgi:hypothetical protein
MNARLETQPEMKISAAKSPHQAQALHDPSGHDDDTSSRYLLTAPMPASQLAEIERGNLSTTRRIACLGRARASSMAIRRTE